MMTSEIGKHDCRSVLSGGTSPRQGAKRPQPSAVSFLVAAREIKDGEEHWSRHTAQIFRRK